MYTCGVACRALWTKGSPIRFSGSMLVLPAMSTCGAERFGTVPVTNQKNLPNQQNLCRSHLGLRMAPRTTSRSRSHHRRRPTNVRQCLQQSTIPPPGTDTTMGPLCEENVDPLVGQINDDCHILEWMMGGCPEASSQGEGRGPNATSQNFLNATSRSPLRSCERSPEAATHG